MSEKEENQTEIFPSDPALIVHSETLPKEKGKKLEDERKKLQKEINDKFYEIQNSLTTEKLNNRRYPEYYCLNNDYYRWENFIKDFFQRQKTNYPDNFKEMKDLGILHLQIESKIASKIKCLGWKFYFQVNLFGDFERVDFSGATFEQEANFHQTQILKNAFFEGATFNSAFTFSSNFFEKTNFKEARFSDKVDFSKANFCEESDFSKAVFLGKAIFSEAVFHIKADFSKAAFADEVNFKKAVFHEEVDFSKAAFVGKASFKKAVFHKKTDFLDIRFFESKSKKSKPFFVFNDASFKDGNLKFIQNEEHSGKIARGDREEDVFYPTYPEGRFIKGGISPSKDEKAYPTRLRSISAKRAIFESPVIFDLQLEECPDFSETHFLKKVSIKETWLKEGKSIKNVAASDEGKFRFFKNYFAKEEGNHFKEAEYFSYEMKAREKGKLKKLTEDGIDLAAKKVCRFLFRKFGKIFQWLGSYFDLCLFKLYKWTSDYGMSIWRPAFWLLVSGAILKFIFSEMSLSDVVIKTISPIKDLEFLPLSNFENLILVIFTLVNMSLIFLLLLGVRNKFKIK